MNKYLIISIIILVSIISFLGYTNKKLSNQYAIAYENIKAYDAELSGVINSNKVYKLTIDQLEYFNDSILKNMNSMRKELKIKDSKIQQMQYKLATVGKTDSIILKDTIFVNSFKLDTIIGDAWYQNHVVMKYPNYIKFSPKFKLESYLFVSSKKETINPPKKFFLLRWFQKKHTVLNITLKENNPYAEVEKQKFVEIIK